jgi:arginine/lysine/histidine/glutamine transport system substrate-binding/permease protein
MLIARLWSLTRSMGRSAWRRRGPRRAWLRRRLLVGGLLPILAAMIGALLLGPGWLRPGLAAGPAAGAATGTATEAAAPWRVGMDPTFPPFQFRDPKSGNVSGFDVELIEAIGRQAGHPIQLVTMPFDGLVPALQAHTIDAAMSAITITAARARSVDFSRPYFQAGQAIVVPAGDSAVRGLEDLRGRRIAVQIGTTGALTAGRVPEARIITFDATPLALQELANGNADAVISDLPAIRYAIKEAGLRGLRIAGEPLTREYYGIAVPTNSRLQQPINQAIGRLIADGSYGALHQRWFNAAPEPLPEVAPALQEKVSPLAGLDLGRLARNLLQGAAITLVLTLLSFSFGVLGGSGLALVLQSHWAPARWCCRVYIDFFRGTPMLVQLFLIYFGLPALLASLDVGFSLNRMAAAVTALSLNVAAYLAETLRSGIESIERGQWEAADALGFSPLERMRFVIAPQAIRRVLPPLANEFITLIKDTSLAAVIGFDELFRQGQLMVATTYRAFEIYIAVALVYLVMTTSASLLFKRLERQLRLPA